MLATSGQPHDTAMRLHGSWLLLARSVWLALAVLSLVYFVATMPGEFARLERVCARAACAGIDLTPVRVRELEMLGLSARFYAAYLVTVKFLSALVWLVTGAVIFWRKPDDRMALFVSLTLVVGGGIAFGGSVDLGAPGSSAWAWVAVFLSFMGNTAIFTFFFLFPDGRFVPGWTGLVALTGALLNISFFFFPHWSVSQWLSAFLFVVSTPFLIIALLAQVYRYRRVSGPLQRQQTKWVVVGIAVALVVSRLVQAVFPLLLQRSVLLVLAGRTLYDVSLLLIPLSIAVAILRYRLWEITILANRTLVYGALTASVAGIYVLIVAALGALFAGYPRGAAPASGNLLISLLATGVVAVLFQPLRERLQRSVNRLLYGARDEPYAVLSRLGQRLEATLAPDAVLPAIVETVKEALKAPYAAVAVKQEDQFTIAAAAGVAPGPEALLHLPLVAHTDVVGELLLAPRAPGEIWNAGDRRLLHDLAYQAGAAVQAVRLTADLQRLTTDLQRSREGLVLAREEERRRLRRDLHDGLGPTLAMLALTAGTVSELIPADPSTAASLANELQNEIRKAIADIRRLVYDLRPPALDELGLVAAIRERAMDLSRPHVAPAGMADRGRLQVTVEAPESLPPVPAAVEVAAYRITQEALTNVVRHARAQTCIVRLSLSGIGDRKALHVEIVDDGAGLPSEHHAGVGLLSMRERAEELGGTCIVKAGEGGGTQISAWLPLP